MTSYIPALTPVVVRPRNNSRLFATPTPARVADHADSEHD